MILGEQIFFPKNIQHINYNNTTNNNMSTQSVGCNISNPTLVNVTYPQQY